MTLLLISRSQLDVVLLFLLLTLKTFQIFFSVSVDFEQVNVMLAGLLISLN